MGSYPERINFRVYTPRSPRNPRKYFSAKVFLRESFPVFRPPDGFPAKPSNTKHVTVERIREIPGTDDSPLESSPPRKSSPQRFSPRKFPSKVFPRGTYPLESLSVQGSFSGGWQPCGRGGTGFAAWAARPCGKHIVISYVFFPGVPRRDSHEAAHRAVASLDTVAAPKGDAGGRTKCRTCRASLSVICVAHHQVSHVSHVAKCRTVARQ